MSILEKKLKVFYLNIESRTATHPPVEERTSDDQAEKLAKQTDSPEVDKLKEQHAQEISELKEEMNAEVNDLKQQLNLMSKALLQQKVEAQTGQQATPEQLQQIQGEAEQKIQGESIQKMKEPGFWKKAMNFMTGDVNKMIRNAPLHAKILIGLTGAVVGTGALALSIAGIPMAVSIGGIGFAGTFINGGLASFGFTGASIVGAKVGLGLLGAMSLSTTVNALRPSDKPQPTTETPASQLVPEQQVQQAPAPEQIVDPEREKMAQNIVSGLKEIGGQVITYGEGEGKSNVDLYYKDGKFNYSLYKKEGERKIGEQTGTLGEQDFLNSLVRQFDESQLQSLQDQINAKKATKNQPAEQVNSPENNEKTPQSLDLKTLKTGDEIKISAKDQFEKPKDLILVVNDDKTVNTFIEKPDGSRQQVAENSFVQSIATAENGKITPSDEVISADENTVVNIGRDYKLNQITKLEVVKPTTPEAETTAPSTPENTKSPDSVEKLNRSDYKNLNHYAESISDAVKDPTWAVNKLKENGVISKTEGFVIYDENGGETKFDLFDYLKNREPNLEKLLGTQETTFEKPEFSTEEVIKTCLVLDLFGKIKSQVKNSKDQNPDKAFSDFRGDESARTIMQIVGENLNTAKSVLERNKINQESFQAYNGETRGNEYKSFALLKVILDGAKTNPLVESALPEKGFKDDAGNIIDTQTLSLEVQKVLDNKIGDSIFANNSNVKLIETIVKFGKDRI